VWVLQNRACFPEFHAATLSMVSALGKSIVLEKKKDLKKK
jgi:hypothetical protein